MNTDDAYMAPDWCCISAEGTADEGWSGKIQATGQRTAPRRMVFENELIGEDDIAREAPTILGQDAAPPKPCAVKLKIMP